MSKLVGVLIAGVAAFSVTNTDDIFFLTIFFSQVNAIFRPWHVVVGQYLGFTVIITISLFGGLIVPEAWVGILGLVPIAMGINRLVNWDKDEEEINIKIVSGESNRSKANTSVVSRLGSLLNPQTYNVVAVELANGGDSIGTYVPLFANRDFVSLGVIVCIFFVLMGVWCYIAYRLTNLPTVARILASFDRVLAPFVLVALGIYLLIENGTYKLLPPFQ